MSTNWTLSWQANLSLKPVTYCVITKYEEKNFTFIHFSYLPPLSMTPVVHLELRICSRIFEIKMAIILEDNQRLGRRWFKFLLHHFLLLVLHDYQPTCKDVSGAAEKLGENIERIEGGRQVPLASRIPATMGTTHWQLTRTWIALALHEMPFQNPVLLPYPKISRDFLSQNYSASGSNG